MALLKPVTTDSILAVFHTTANKLKVHIENTQLEVLKHNKTIADAEVSLALAIEERNKADKALSNIEKLLGT